MFVSRALIVATILASAQAFTVAPATRVATPLFMSEEVATEEAPAKEAAPAPTSTTGISIPAVRKSIKQLTKDNFSATLTELEPYFLNDAGASFYAKSLRRIENSAKALGVDMPADYAKAAKATAKRREKQDAFVQQKIQEAADAEPEAEEEPAAEEPAAEE